MNTYIKITLCLFIIFIIFYNIKYISNEYFDTELLNNKTKEENRDVFHNKSINDVYHGKYINEDKLFSDLILFENDDNIYQSNNDKIGLQKCVTKCNGKCVEYGITGNTFCFPK